MMRRRRMSDVPLRGSVRQNTTVRVRPRAATPFGFLFRFGLLTAAAGLVILLGIWLWHSGWPQREAEHLAETGLRATQKAEFSVKDIVVEGREQTAKDVLLNALDVNEGAPILGFDPAAAQARIEKLPWVASAIVERRLPDTILVRLTERIPLARWQHEGRTVVIDGEGKELPDAKPEQFPALPLVVGADAPGETKDLLAALDHYPAIAKVMTAAVRVGGRRWDLHLDPKVVAKMPEQGLDAALQNLSQLIVGQKILERDIISIDLRMPDRYVIEPANGASVTHPAGDMRL